MRTHLISIITPVFNVEDGPLELCAKSVLSQSYEDFEWLLVDDGSEEERLKALDRLAHMDPRVRVIRCPHRGVSATRNTGISQAEGDIVTFLDADDELTPHCLMKAARILTRYNADVVYGMSEDVYWWDDTAPTAPRKEEEPLLLSQRDLTDFRRTCISSRPVAGGKDLTFSRPLQISSKYYRADFVRGQRFATDVHIGEDGLFSAVAASRARALVIVRDVWYRYHRRKKTGNRQFSHADVLAYAKESRAFWEYGKSYGWNASDIGMRYFIITYNILQQYGSYRSLRELWRTTAACFKDADIHAAVKKIRLSAYQVRWTTVILVHLMRHRLALPYALLLRTKRAT